MMLLSWSELLLGRQGDCGARHLYYWYHIPGESSDEGRRINHICRPMLYDRGPSSAIKRHLTPCCPPLSYSSTHSDMERDE